MYTKCRARLGILFGLTITVLAAVAIGTPAAAAIAPTLAVKTLKVAPATVTGPAGAAVSTVVTWTITDTDRTATTVSGALTIRLQGAQPGTYVGLAHTVPYRFNQAVSGGATFLSGTPMNSSYSDIFSIPQYASTATATWVVTDLTITDDRGHSSDNGNAVLSKFHRSVVNKTQLIDTTAPTFDNINLTANTQGPQFVLANGSAFTESYTVSVQDSQAGLWKGSATITGTGGGTLTGDFEFVPGQFGGTCGTSFSFSDQQPFCGFQVTVPADAAAGTWSVSSITLTDNAGNTQTYNNLDTASFVLTADNLVNAHDFSVNPNPVNNWATSVTPQLTFAVSGAQNGIGAVYITFGEFFGCTQPSTTPVTNPDGTVSVPFSMFQGVSSCTVSGIAVVDGGGDASVYGAFYHAPDLGLKITQVPDTTPPTVVSARMDTATVPTNPNSSGPISFTVVISAPVAPVNFFIAALYDSNGNHVLGSDIDGGVPNTNNGPAQLFVDLPINIAPGTYTVGFTITDAGFLSTSYGIPGGQPVPGGPLTLTVTPAA